MPSYLRDRSGAAALEFALVAPLFIGLMVSVFELGWSMTKMIMLDRAVTMTARELRVGREGGFTQDYVKGRVCALAVVFPDCVGSTIIELIPLAIGDPAPSDSAVCVDRARKIVPVVRFNPGSPTTLVLMRVCIESHIFTPGMGYGLNLNAGLKDGYFRYVGKSAYYSEPI